MVALTDTRLRTELLDRVRDLVTTAVREPQAVQETARALAVLACDHLPWDHAGISVRERNGSLRNLGSTDPVVELFDTLQDTSGEGPSLDCLDDGTELLVADLGVEPRWPQWRDAVTEIGLQGVVTARLVDHLTPRAVLNLYATTTRHVTPEHLELVRLFAREASFALQVTGEVWNLHQAIAHRTVIGQAKGVLMEKYGMDAEQAFAVLVRASSHTNSKLHAVASEVVSTRQLPTPVRPDPPS